MLEQRKESGGFEWQQPVGVQSSDSRSDYLGGINVPTLARFFRQQSLYIAVSAVVGAIFWAIGQQINPATVLVYCLCIGNLLSPAIGWLEFLYADRPFPYDLLIFLTVLLVLTVPIYLIATVVVWLVAPPSPQTLSHLITTGWKFPFLITFVFGILSFLYHSTKERLERRNVELQQTVERGTVRLEMQEQELERAREIQQSLLPKEIPQLPGFEVAGAWQPASTVSGDYYDVLRLDDHRLGICIADVVGKGVSAALLMANVQAAVRAFASELGEPCPGVRQGQRSVAREHRNREVRDLLLWNSRRGNAYVSVQQRRTPLPDPCFWWLNPYARAKRGSARRFPKLEI